MCAPQVAVKRLICERLVIGMMPGMIGTRMPAARARRTTYLLSGLVRCAHCGKVMVGVRNCGVQKFYCSGYYKAKLCYSNFVYQDNLVIVLKEIIREHLFCGGNWNALKAAIVRKAKGRPECNVPSTETLKRQYETVKTQYQRAAQNLLLADPEHVPTLNAAVGELRQHMRALQCELATVRRPVSGEKLTNEVITKAKALFDDLMNSNGDRLKNVLSELVNRIELRFGDGLWGKRKVRVVTGCDVYLNAATSFTTVGRDDCNSSAVNAISAGAEHITILNSHRRRRRAS